MGNENCESITTGCPMKRDLSAQILLGYVGCSVALALSSPLIPLAFPWLTDLPTVNTLAANGARESEVLAYFSLMWCLLPAMLAAMMIWSPGPTKIALESSVERLLFFSVFNVLVIPLFIWILCFIGQDTGGVRLKGMIYLSSHSRIGLGLIYGFAFDGLLILLFGLLFALPRLWFLRMQNPR